VLDQVSLFAAAILANTLSALAGGGAGLLQLPLLLFLGLPFGTALATHKIASVALGVGATIRHTREGKLDYRRAAFILGTGLPGVVLGALLVVGLSERVAKGALGVLTMGLGVYSAFKPALGQDAVEMPRTRRHAIVGGVGLFVIGFLNGSLTSGTGLFVTLWLVRWFGLGFKEAVVYTLILVGLFWNGFGAATLALQAPVHWAWLPALITGSLIGGYLGAHWSIARGNAFVKRSFEVMTLAVGAKLVASAL
jgi:uncharacterized protein